MASSQPVEVEAETSASPAAPMIPAIQPLLFEQLWLECGAATWGLARFEFSEILFRIGDAQNYGQPSGVLPSGEQQAVFFRSLKLADLVLARACASGNERAWEHFLALYHQPLTRAAIAITGSETQGRELADSLYAELYGLTTRNGSRRCPLDSYRGRGSLIGWLRTILAQRHVDHHRQSRREEPLAGSCGELDPAAPEPEPVSIPAQLNIVGIAIERAVAGRPAEDRFLMAAYYLDGRTLLQIARALRVHEATVSRKLRRVIDDLRKQVLRHLQDSGLSKRAAQEALGADPRDLDLNLKKLLQTCPPGAFPEKPVL